VFLVSRFVLSVCLLVGLLFSPIGAVPSAGAAPDRPPRLEKIKRQQAVAGHTFTLQPRAVDPKPGPRALRYTAKGRPGWLKLNRRTGLLRGTAPLSQVGRTAKIKLVVTDGRRSARRTFRLTVRANRGPVIPELTPATLRVEQPFSLRTDATDPDDGPSSLSYVVSYDAAADAAEETPSWLSIDSGTGVLSGTPPRSAAGSAWTVTIGADDGQTTTERSFELTVLNERPTLEEIPDQAVEVGDEVSYLLLGADADGPAGLAYAKTDGPDWLQVDEATGTVTGTVPPGAAAGDGVVSASFTVSDGRLASASRSMTLVVSAPAPDNNPPSIADQAFTVAEDLPVGGRVGTLVATDTDTDDDLTFSVAPDSPFTVEPGTGVLRSAEALDHESDPELQVVVTVSDGAASDSATVVVTVDDVDESPVLADLDDVTTVEDAPLTPFVISAVDPEGEDVTLSVTSLPIGLSFDAATGRITGTPTRPGTTVVRATADDGTSAPAETTFDIVVLPVNDAPVLAAQSFSVPEGAADGTVVGRLAAVDEDGDDLVFSGGSDEFDVAGDGTVTVADASALVDGAGPFTFTATVDDGDATDSAEVTVRVVDVDFAPVAQDDTFSVPEDAPLDTEVGTVRAEDPDGDTLTFAITDGNAGNGFAIDPATGDITVAGPLDHEVVDAYTLTVTATAGTKSDTATVTIDVADVDEAPVITPIDDQDVTEDEPLEPVAVEATDPDGQQVVVDVAGLPAGVQFADGSIVGTPTVSGDFVVVVTATAGTLQSSISFVLSVTDVNDAPVIGALPDVTVAEDSAITPITPTATDEDSDEVTLTVGTLPTGLSFAGGTISGTPTVAGSYVVTVTADDGEGGEATEQFTLTVTPTPDAPTITSVTPSSLGATVGQPVSTQVSVVATDEDGDPLTTTLTGLPAGLSATASGGTVTVTGTPTTAGTTTALVTVSDGTLSDTADLVVTVAPAADDCAPRSLLPCADVPVELPYELAFDGTEGGLDASGFTMVDPPSLRGGVDQSPAPATPSTPSVPGYEPALTDVTGGELRITATKGIMFRAPGQNPAATAPNGQLNALGVGVTGSDTGYELETTVVAPTFPGAGNSSQQGGLWFGLDEDDYVKLVVSRVSSTTNKVQLLKEVGGVATPGTTYELNSAAFPAGQDVRLRLEVEDTPGTGATGAVVRGFYSVGTSTTLVPVTEAANPDSPQLPVPQALVDGVVLDPEVPDAVSFAGLFATKRNALATEPISVRFADFSVDGLVQPNMDPVIGTIAPASVPATRGTPLVASVAVPAEDADGDPLTRSVTGGLPPGITATPTSTGIDLSGTPTQLGTSTVTVSVSDGRGGVDTGTFSLVVTEPATACTPISSLPCTAVPVDLPVSLDFDGTEGGLAGTGFTLVDAPSARGPVNQAPAPAAPTNADVPGFEAGLLSVAGGALTIRSTKGIQYKTTTTTTGGNSQLNALGVGVQPTTGTGYELATSVVAPTFPGPADGAQQGGLWFGIGEDDYVKLVVSRVSATTNKVQLVTEVAGFADSTTEINSAPFAAGADVRLVLSVDGSTARATYAVGTGALQPLTDAATPTRTSLPVPTAFTTGAALPDGTVASRAGLFASKRNAGADTQVPVAFASFDVRETGVASPGEPIDVTVDFTTATGPLTAGALRDFGQPFDARTGADQGAGDQRYGWVKAASEEPLSLVGNARVRTLADATQDQNTLIHAQYADVPGGDCAVNVCDDGDWLFDLENGSYDVTVTVGDQMGATAYDSLHAINVENQVLIEGFQGSDAQRFQTTTTTVGVIDGELTVSATGGTNTKISSVRIVSHDPEVVDPRPFVVDVRPGNRTTGVRLDEGIATDLHLVGTDATPAPVDDTTIGANVKLFEVVPGAADPEVAGNNGTSGGGDVITFQQTGNLKPNTTYRFVIDGVRDTQGTLFVPFTSVFTTGTQISGGGTGSYAPVTGVNFEKVDLAKDGKYFASLVVHQGFLWATTIGQGMYRYPINANGTLGAEQAINAFAGRAAVGLVFDRNDPNVAWVTNATANIGNESQQFGSKLTRVDFSGSVANPVLNDVFVNLPRSLKDHLSNSISYGPGGDLYFLQGSNQAAGDPDGAWGNRGETLLTAAMLTFDPETTWAQVQASGPIDVQTVDRNGTYNPFAANAPLKIYATGIRNAYDLVHTSTGRLYAPTNGTAAGGNSPGVTSTGGTLTRTGQVPGADVTQTCATRRIDGTPYTAPSVPAVTNHNTQRDFLFDVRQGGYYGHPNPARCEWVLNNGSGAEGAGQGGSKYPAGVAPDRNYRGWAYDFEFNKSPNGVIEYRSNTFGGKLKGRLMVVRYSNFDDVLTMQPGSDGTILGAQPGSTIGGLSGFDDPLDITEDTRNGNLYVNSYDQTGGAPKLYLLRVPTGQQASPLQASTTRVVGNQPTGSGSRTLGTVTVTNGGDTATTVQSATIAGPGAATFTRTVSSALPATLAPGASLTVQVGFDPTTEGVSTASLTVSTADGSAPTVTLRGLGTDGLGGDNEPSLQYVFDVHGLGIDTGDDNDATNAIHSNSGQRVDPTLGDSLDVETFTRASDAPVTLEPLSVFGPTDTNPVTRVSWYDTATPATRNALFSVSNNPASNGQTITPTVTGAVQFDPGAATFGFVSQWPFFADRLVHSQDSLNTFNGAIGNHVRVYRLVENGAVVPDAYVVATEEHVSGFDFQDVVYIARNVRPAGTTVPPPPDGETIRVNFQSETAAVPTGYLRDFGQAYGARTAADQGGRSYGWLNAQTGVPEARTGNGRDRDVNADQRLDTFTHLQFGQVANANCTANNCNPGSWEIALPNGAYRVVAAVGDPNAGADPELHQLRAEGTALFAQPYQPTGAAGSATRHSVGAATVQVSDGRLTVDPTGGTNTKIAYVEITPVEATGGDDVARVNFQPATEPVPSGWSADNGDLFTAGRGYGWVRTEGGAPKTADTRKRPQDADPLDGTLMIVDDAVVAATNNGEWEYALANGTYTVTASVGDPSAVDSTHGLRVEGTPLVSGFVPATPSDYLVASTTVEVADGRLTVASTGSNTKLQWLRISSGSAADVVPPSVALTVEGVQEGTSYVNAATVAGAISDTGGSNLEFVDWTLDGQPVPDPAGDRLRVTGTGSHTVTVTATDGAGNQTARSVTFSIVAGQTSAIRVNNPDTTAGDGLREDLLVMHLLSSGKTTHRSHDTARLQITNTDASNPLRVSALELSAPAAPLTGVRPSTTNFSTPGTTLPLTVAPGASATVDVLFSGAGTRGIYGATMTVVSNAANAPRLPVQLRGFWQPVPEGGTEPTLTQVMQTFGFTTTLGEPLRDPVATPLQGDEVRSNLWRRLDPSQPVRARQLSALHGCCGQEDLFEIAGAGGGSFRHDGAWGQSLLPRVATGGDALPTAGPARGSFNPTGTFEIKAAGYSTVPTAQGSLSMRLWPVEYDGVVVPGAYLVGQDFVQNGCSNGGSANCDYQDNTFLVTNIAPVAPLDTTAPATAPTGVGAAAAGQDVAVTWTAVSADDLSGYVVQRQVAGATGWTNVNVTPTTATRLVDTGAPGSTSVSYRVLAVDTSRNASAASATAKLTTPPKARNPLRINAGGPAVTTGGVAWGAQQFGTGGKTFANAVAIAGTTDDVLFQTEYSTATGGIDYDIPVQNGDYTVRLHFAEIYFGAPGGGPGGNGRRVFDVFVEGSLRLDNFDIFQQAGAATAVTRSYDVSVTDGKVDVDLDSVVDQAKISAIEVLPR
jgi:hypothetical protein